MKCWSGGVFGYRYIHLRVQGGNTNFFYIVSFFLICSLFFFTFLHRKLFFMFFMRYFFFSSVRKISLEGNLFYLMTEKKIFPSHPKKSLEAKFCYAPVCPSLTQLLTQPVPESPTHSVRRSVTHTVRQSGV